MQDLDTELVDCRAEVRKQRVQIENLTTEKSMLQAERTRLTQENTTLTAQRTSQGELFANLQSIIDGMRHDESAMRTRLLAQADDYKSECAQLRKRLADAEDAYQMSKARLEKEVVVGQTALAAEQRNHAVTRTTAADAQAEATALGEARDALQATVDATQRKLDAVLAASKEGGSEPSQTALEERLNAALMEKTEVGGCLHVVYVCVRGCVCKVP